MDTNVKQRVIKYPCIPNKKNQEYYIQGSRLTDDFLEKHSLDKNSFYLISRVVALGMLYIYTESNCLFVDYSDYKCYGERL
jgi:hypothetical protein